MDMIEQEIEQEKQLCKIDDTNGETNPYQELIVNKCRKSRNINHTNGAMVNPE